MSDVIKAEVERKLAALPQVREVKVEIVFDPPGEAACRKPPNCTSASTPICGARAASRPFKILR